MRHLRETANRGFASVARAIRLQPGYHTEVSDDYLKALAAKIEAEKPKNFSLTPISEPGW